MSDAIPRHVLCVLGSGLDLSEIERIAADIEHVAGGLEEYMAVVEPSQRKTVEVVGFAELVSLQCRSISLQE